MGLHLKQLAPTNNLGFYFTELLPAVYAAMGFDNII